MHLERGIRREGCAGAEERARVMDLGRKLQAMPGQVIQGSKHHTTSGSWDIMGTCRCCFFETTCALLWGCAKTVGKTKPGSKSGCKV